MFYSDILTISKNQPSGVLTNKHILDHSILSNVPRELYLNHYYLKKGA